MPRTPFTSGRHGFHFSNGFVNTVADIPFFGKVQTQGRCGGMAYAALDYYYAGLPVPTHKAADFPGTGVPPDGSRLADYIYRRLLDSFLTPSAINYISLSMHSDHATWFFKGLTRWTKEDEFPKLRARIDSGTPVVLGLIAARDVTQVGSNHQVVAYGYDYDEASGIIQVYIYDNNFPDQEVVLSTDPGNPHVNASLGGIWRGFFVHDYARQAPPYLDLAMCRGVWVSSSSPYVGSPFDCQYAVRNYGDHPAHLSSLHLSLLGPAGENLDSQLGSDGNSAPLQPGEERTILKATQAFGTTPGTYAIGALYRSEQNEWIPLPPGEPGTANEVAVLAQSKPKETKEGKETKDKEKEKERKEKDKERAKEAKELTKEKDKDLTKEKEGEYAKPQEALGFPRPASLEERLAGLEAEVGRLTHFIGPGLRPEVASSPLSREPGFPAALRQQHQKQAADAKQAKDQKESKEDGEKLRDR